MTKKPARKTNVDKRKPRKTSNKGGYSIVVTIYKGRRVYKKYRTAFVGDIEELKEKRRR